MKHAITGSDDELVLPHGRNWFSRAVDDPARIYYWPIVGRLYRKRVLACLKHCTGGDKILEIGFGSGVTFLTLGKKYGEIHGVDLHAPVNRLQDLFRSQGVNCLLRNGSALALPYPDEYFDTVLLISILEHLTPGDVRLASREIRRVLKRGQPVVYGVPVERPLMRLAFFLLGYNIRKHHFSTETQVSEAMREVFVDGRIETLSSPFGPIYQVGKFWTPPPS